MIAAAIVEPLRQSCHYYIAMLFITPAPAPAPLAASADFAAITPADCRHCRDYAFTLIANRTGAPPMLPCLRQLHDDASQIID